MFFSYSPYGYEGSVIRVEAEHRHGIPAMDIVGLSDGSVKATRCNVKAAIKNSGYECPPERVLVALSPADLRKEGCMFDFALAVAILCQSEGIDCGEDVAVLGELRLDGTVHPKPGILTALQSLKRELVYKAVIPVAYTEEIPAGMEVLRVASLGEAIELLRSGGAFKKQEAEKEKVPVMPELERGPTLDDVEGCGWLKYAMAVAAAGGHHLLVWGGPGSGKTMTLQHMPELLPNMTREESETTERIYDLAGLMPTGGIGWNRPFRAPHQTATIEGMFGGGPKLMPGEITLAHNGVLFLDEATEFKTSIMQMLRVPMESGAITLSWAGRSTVFPARFQLVVAMTPCPCGNFGVEGKMCLCKSTEVNKHWSRIPEPTRNRIAIRVDCADDCGGDTSLATLREQVSTAFSAQMKRQGYRNEQLSPAKIAEYRSELFTNGADDFLREYEEDTSHTLRDLANVIKLSMTVADMLGEDTVTSRHVGTAIKLHRKVLA